MRAHRCGWTLNLLFREFTANEVILSTSGLPLHRMVLRMNLFRRGAAPASDKRMKMVVELMHPRDTYGCWTGFSMPRYDEGY